MSNIKKILFLTPILLIRRIILSLVTLGVTLGILLYVLGNSSLVIKKAIDYFAPDYNITYRNIDGNIFTGIKVYNLSYENFSLAKKITIKWNPIRLLYKNIGLSNIDIDSLDIDNVMMFSRVFNSSNDDTDSNSSMPFSISVNNIDITINKFIQSDIYISKFKLKANALYYNNNSVNLKILKLFIDTNLTTINVNGLVKNNRLKGKLLISPKDGLFKQYNIPIRHKAIKTLAIDFNATKDIVEADIDTSIKKVLKTDNKNSFNIDINSLKSHILFNIDDNILIAKSKLLIDSNYAKDIYISNDFILKNNNIRYSGNMKTNNILGVDKRYLKLLKNLNIGYIGDNKSIKADINTNKLKGLFVSNDFRKGKLHLASKDKILLSKFIDLASKLSKGRASFVLDAPIYFDNNVMRKAKVKITSNLLNIESDIKYKDNLNIVSKIVIPKKSLLKGYDKNLKLNKLNPIYIKSIIDKKEINTIVKSPVIKANINYRLKSTKLNGLFNLEGYKINISGNTNSIVDVKLNINSLKSFFKKISKVYNIDEIPNISGKVDCNVSIDKLKDINMIIKSPKIIYAKDKKHKQIIKDISLKVGMNNSKIVLKNYKFIYNKEKIFSTKPSKVSIDGDIVNIEEFWVNNNLKIEGRYNLKTKKGNILTSSNKFHIAQKIASLDTNLNLKVLLDNMKMTINGNINLLGGNIYYNLSKKTFASDSDIVIVQKIKKKKKSSFMKNLSLNIKVKTKKPLRYKKGDANIRGNLDLGIHKSINSKILILGKVSLLKGGSYTFERKRFILDKSSIYFTGNPNKPILNIVVHYKSINHLITIRITGSANTPNIVFSSSPTLTKGQILSLLLFDTEEAAGKNSSEDMMRMMGGAIAKSALNNVGISLDHLVIGNDNSIEVGKKITNKLTVIYVNGKIPKIKVKYRHSRSTESIFSGSEVSQSYDIVYKKDF